jgi:tetratricopeptide (TPR) repeat protein
MPEVVGEAAAYGLQEAADLVGLSRDRVWRLVRAGLVAAERGAGGALRLSFHDLTFLRRMRDFDRARIAPRRVRRALQQLRDRLPESDLTRVPLDVAAGQVVVREDGVLWSAESGQCVFDFDRPAAATVVSLEPEGTAPRRGMSADAWYQLGCDLEETDAQRAREAYLLAIETDPACARAHVNLGCLEHEAGRLDAAEAHYRAALEARPGDATSWFDLAVVLEDRSRPDDACDAYERALAADPSCAEAHFNLARLLERAGDAAGAVRHLAAYKRLSV